MDNIDKDAIQIKERMQRIFKLIEMWFWGILLITSFLLIFLVSFRKDLFNISDLEDKHYVLFYLLPLVALFPFLFYFIFTKLPIEFFRYKVNNPVSNAREETAQKIDFIDLQIKESTDIAERLYSNSRAYLMIGCLVALAGVAIFYAPIWQTTTHISIDLTSSLLDILPRFGALFFIEYIALFFLKQYRILLEDYRYYEAIKRDRQNKRLFLDLVEKYSDNSEVLKILIDYLNEHPVRIPMITGDHKIQSEKAMYGDMDVISKITELVKAVKLNK